MRKWFILSSLMCTALFAQAQDAKDILIQSFKKCQSINSGYFIVNSVFRTVLPTPVNANYSYKVNFRKTINDSVSPCLYNAQFLSKQNDYQNIIYTGKEHVTYANSTKMNYVISRGNSSVNWLFPVETSSFYSVFSPGSQYADDWFYRGVDIPSGEFANYLQGNSNWVNSLNNATNDEGELIFKAKFAKVVTQKCNADLFMLFEPVMAKNSVLLPNYAALVDDNTVFNFINTEILYGYRCWHVQAVKTIKSDSVKLKKPIMYTSDHWINMKDLVPIQYILVKELLVGNDIHEYYRKYTISDYEFNTIKDDWYFTLSRVPKYVTLKIYVIK